MSVIVCNVMQCNAMQCNAMSCNAMQCNSLLLYFSFSFSPGPHGGAQGQGKKQGVSNWAKSMVKVRSAMQGKSVRQKSEDRASARSGSGTYVPVLLEAQFAQS